MVIREVLASMGFGEDESGLTPVEKLLQEKNPASDIASIPLKQWDKGVFSLELMKQKLIPSLDPKNSNGKQPEPLSEGTYGGTQLAITEYYDRIEKAYSSAFEAIGVERVIPFSTDLDEKQQIYRYEGGGPGDMYPPHLREIPKCSKDDVSVLTIFNKLDFLRTAAVLTMIIPKNFIQDIVSGVEDAVIDVSFGKPYAGPTIADCEKYNNGRHQTGTDIMRGKNIGNLSDWYTDARFAQQALTGANPTSITLASAEWIQGYVHEAKRQGLGQMVELLEECDKSSLYIQDYSYFKKAVGVSPEDVHGLTATDDWGTRYGCASVTLYRLPEDGKLHPLAICIDWRGSWEATVTIFNKRLGADEIFSSEKEDWPWRYAKTCAQTSDWTHHEVSAHLTFTHMIEEATIVASHRHLPEHHMVYRLLEPHWFRTLSLNAAARRTLVPDVISKLLGMETQKTYDLIKYEYKNFNWVDHYVPNDLAKRGFPPSKLENKKFRNCAYAKDASLMWAVLKKFVTSMLKLAYESDADVKADKYIKNWCDEIRSDDGAQIKSFPVIETIDQLADAVTMCIHIASPQHTAVNYEQNYYMAFVAARPPALFSPLPRTIEKLKQYDEKALTAALPIGEAHSKAWLLASQLPHLLSYKVAEDYNILNYAHSLWHLYKCKHGKDADGVDQDKVRAYAYELYGNLTKLEDKFTEYSQNMTRGTVPYIVLNPKVTAVSILI